MLASVTKRPVTKAIPQINSIDFANGIKYVDATSPELKALKLSFAAGSAGIRWKKKLIDAKSNKRPIKVRIIIVAIFMI